MGIGKRIKEARERLGLTQKELANQIGVTAPSITNYENEVSHPKEPILYKLLDALQVDANYLFQDCFSEKLLSTPVLSIESVKVAEAYDKADLKNKNIVRQALDLPPLPATPAKDMEASTDFDIEQELTDYRRELEAEQKGRTTAASDNTKGA